MCDMNDPSKKNLLKEGTNSVEENKNDPLIQREMDLKFKEEQQKKQAGQINQGTAASPNERSGNSCDGIDCL